MICLPLYPAVLGRALAQIVQLAGPYDSKTDQTDQTDQRIETAGKFGALFRPKLTSRHSKLTSRADRRSGSLPPCASDRSTCALQIAARQSP
jgi:hypothetical protein